MIIQMFTLGHRGERYFPSSTRGREVTLVKGGIVPRPKSTDHGRLAPLNGLIGSGSRVHPSPSTDPEVAIGGGRAGPGRSPVVGEEAL